MTQGEDVLTAKEEVEKKLSEKRLDQEVARAEVTDVVAETADGPVVFTFTTVSGMELTEVLPLPDEYDPADSDLACLIEFVDGDPSDLDSLEGQRVPCMGGKVRFAAMRRVLGMGEHATSEWNTEKRLEKAAKFME